MTDLLYAADTWPPGFTQTHISSQGTTWHSVGNNKYNITF